MRFRYRHPHWYALGRGAFRLSVGIVAVLVLISVIVGVMTACQTFGWYVGGPVAIAFFIAVSFVLGHND